MNRQAARDLVDAWLRMRAEMDAVARAVMDGTVTSAEVERMEALFEDFAGVIRVTVGTRQIGDALEQQP
jgi:hypothetical protein